MSDSACIWTWVGNEDDYWHTSCDQDYCIIDGTPTDNGMKFCCYCGKPITEVVNDEEE